MAKKLLSALLALTLIFSLAVTASAATQSNAGTSGEVYEVIDYDPTLDRANVLKDLGLFLGTDKGFDLERAPTRVEALVLLIRTLGEERASKWTWFDRHPFTDVPSWADNYVTYAYTMGYSNGMSATSFGSSDIVTPEQFITFMLRALGYSDARGDFVWSESIQKAEELNIVPANKYNKDMIFLRGDCVDIIFDVLKANPKDENVTLAEKLFKNGAIDFEIALKYNFLDLKKLVQEGSILGMYDELEDVYVEEVVRLVNIERVKHGLHELRHNPELSKVAQIKVEDISENAYYDHISPIYGSPSSMMRDFGISFRTSGENIAMGQFTPKSVVSQWLESPGHRANILNPKYTDIGVGFTWGGVRWAQMFIGQ